MAHLIMEHDNMLSVRQIPWHGLGIVVEDYPSIEQAQQLSGLTWSVRKEPVYYRMPAVEGMSRIMKVDDQFAIVRNDNQYPLGIVGKHYEPFQNDQMFEFMGQFMEHANSKLETCGSLRNGAVVWALAQSGQTEYVKNDTISKYFLIKNGFDASQNLEIIFTDIRVVCNNTLQAALREAKNGYRVRHTANIHAQVAAISDALKAEAHYNKALTERMVALAKKKMSGKMIEFATQKIVGTDQIDVELLVGDELTAELTAYQTKTANRILELVETGSGTDIAGVRGTAYGLLNACTEWADHERIIRPGERAYAEARFESIMVGSAAKFKQRAFNILCDYAIAA